MTDAGSRSGRIIVIGSANMDVIARVPHLPGEGETVLGESLLHAPGGKGANQAVAAARAGSHVWFVGRVGEDAHGAGLLESMQLAGVDTELAGVDPSAPTGVALITVDDEGRNAIAVVPGANAQVSIDDVDRAMDVIEGSAVVVLQLEIQLETVGYAMRAAHSAGASVILNPAPAARLDPPFLRSCDILVPNRVEAARLAGLGPPTEPARVAHLLVEAGVPAVVVTLGAEGAVVVTAQEETTIPAFPVRSVDTTGAGDAFVGNLAHGVAAGQSLEQAARFAMAAAAVSVQRAGAQPAMPSHAETTEFLREYAS